MGFFIMPIFLSILSLLILYFLIQSAIDGSKTAAEIKQIRMLLQKQYLASKGQNTEGQGMAPNEENGNYEIIDTPYDACPACGAYVQPEDTECKSCGLKLQ